MTVYVERNINMIRLDKFLSEMGLGTRSEVKKLIKTGQIAINGTVAAKPEIKVMPLGIGGKESPARLTFDGAEGDAICVSLVDMGGRMRMIVQDVKAYAPLNKMPNLPVAGVMWKPLPNLQTAAECWILAGGPIIRC